MTELKRYYQTIESAIKELGINPGQIRGEDPGQWNMQTGETPIWIDVWQPEKADEPLFQVMAPFMTEPENNKEAFYAELLKINNNIFTLSFALNKGYVYLKCIREANGLTREEVLSTLQHCGYYVDYYEKRLIESFGGKKLVAGA